MKDKKRKNTNLNKEGFLIKEMEANTRSWVDGKKMLQKILLDPLMEMGIWIVDSIKIFY